MDKDDITAAVKTVRARKGKPNFMLVTLSYSKNYILPYADGIKMMEALANAEQLFGEYKKPTTIQSIAEKVEFTTFSSAEYERIKTAMLLGVNSDDIPLNTFED